MLQQGIVHLNTGALSYMKIVCIVWADYRSLLSGVPLVYYCKAYMIKGKTCDVEH